MVSWMETACKSCLTVVAATCMRWVVPKPRKFNNMEQCKRGDNKNLVPRLKQSLKSFQPYKNDPSATPKCFSLQSAEVAAKGLACHPKVFRLDVFSRWLAQTLHQFGLWATISQLFASKRHSKFPFRGVQRASKRLIHRLGLVGETPSRNADCLFHQFMFSMWLCYYLASCTCRRLIPRLFIP